MVSKNIYRKVAQFAIKAITVYSGEFDPLFRESDPPIGRAIFLRA